MGIIALAFLIIFVSIAYLDIEIMKLRSEITKLKNKKYDNNRTEA